MNIFRHMFEPGWIGQPGDCIAVVWTVWLVSWLAASLWSRRVAARASLAQELPYRLLTVVGIFLQFGFFQLAALPRLWPSPPELLWAMLALVVTGFLFAWWARLHLGALWSGTVTRKDDHRIVESGPYAIARHPIYTGLLLASFATAIALGRLETIAGACLFALGCWLKARIEEGLLSETLGAEYQAYRARVPMLVPLLK